MQAPNLNSRRILRVAVPLLLALAAGATQEDDTPPAGGDPQQGQPPEETPGETAGEKADAAATSETPDESGAVPAADLPIYETGYHDLTEVRLWVDAWVRGMPEICRALELAPTAAGRPLFALEWGGPGPIALHARPTVFLVGGLDGTSLSGAEAVLAATSELLARPDELPSDVAFVSIPWASPDGLAQVLEGRARDGRNERPFDEDADGKVDEDGPDDIDSDGMILEMLVEDPDGAWVRAADPRFLRRARDGDPLRYRWVPEGRDDDGDGRFNEDGLGGVNLDRNFPVGWRGPWHTALAGRLPLSESSNRELADLMLERRTVAVLLFQGNHGRLAMPGGQAGAGLVASCDLAAFRYLARGFRSNAATRSSQAGELTPPTLFEARGGEATGSALDWIYAVPGALAVEVAVWGPHLERSAGGENLTLATFEPEGPAEGPRSYDSAWLDWLDNARGGIGFEDWHPVDLDDGTQVLVGGWKPFTRLNPPVESLEGALEGVGELARYLMRELPRLEVEVATEREGEICHIHARARNLGSLPTGLSSTGRWRSPDGDTEGVLIELVLPEGALLLAGDARVRLGPLHGRGATPRIDWVVLAAERAVFEVRVRSPWTVDVVEEVRP